MSAKLYRLGVVQVDEVQHALGALLGSLAGAHVFAHGGAHVAHDVPQALRQARAHQQLEAVLALVVGEEGLAQALEHRLLPLHLRGKAQYLSPRRTCTRGMHVAAGKDAVLGARRGML